MKLKLLKGTQILCATAGDNRPFLVLGDLHIGLTDRLGLARPLPEEEAADVCQRIESAGKATGARSLIILGDLKHGLFAPSVHEKKALRVLTEEMVGKFEVWVMKGNHDYGVEEAMDPRVRMIGKSGLEMDRVVFMHGHSLPRLSDMLESYEMIVSGHIHPQLVINGRWEPVWLTLKSRRGQKPLRIIILPHFSNYASRVGYRPGPPVKIAPFLRRLDLNRYDYEIRDLSLNKLAGGRALDVMAARSENGAGRI